MSIEHSVICDRCGSVVSAASTVALARSDATRLGAQQDAREDLCARCSGEGGTGVSHPLAGQLNGSKAQRAAATSPTRRLGIGLAELLDEFIREAVDLRIADLSGDATTTPADRGPGSAASDFSERMSR